MAEPTAAEMARAVDYLRQRLDQIEKTVLDLPEIKGLWVLHTPDQVAAWLDAQFVELAGVDKR